VDILVRVLGPGDAAVLAAVADDVFDGPVDPRWAAEFVADPRHHLAVALADGVVVGMASGVHYVHPDKPPELWVNEVGVAPAYQNRGIGRRLLRALFARGRAVGCATGWVGTAADNAAARRLYRAAGGTEDPEAFVTVTFDLAEAGGPDAAE
jgi:aminoglycoside 6'-N-acetyltransferase I